MQGLFIPVTHAPYFVGHFLKLLFTSCKKIGTPGQPIWVHLNCTNKTNTGTARMRSHPQSERTFGSNWWGLLRPKRGEERWETNGRRLSWELVGKEVHVQMYFIAQSWDWFTRLFIFSFIIFFSVYTHLSQTSRLNTFGQDWDAFLKEVGSCLVMLEGQVEITLA